MKSPNGLKKFRERSIHEVGFELYSRENIFLPALQIITLKPTGNVSFHLLRPLLMLSEKTCQKRPFLTSVFWTGCTKSTTSYAVGKSLDKKKTFSAVGVRRSTDGKTGLLKFKLFGRRQAPCCCTTTPASTHTRPQQAPHKRTAVTMEAANVSIRVCSVATTAVAAGVALCGKVIYTALSSVCH